MKVVFRVDSGNSMGGGHLSRCLTLANKLREAVSACCYFIIRKHPGYQSKLIENSGFEYSCLPLNHEIDYFNGNYEGWVGAEWQVDSVETKQKLLEWSKTNTFDWMIVDHYGLDEKWEQTFINQGLRVGVIDDLVNRPHVCHFLVDQTCGRLPKEYVSLVDHKTKLLTGERFCLMRPDFFEYRGKSLKFKKEYKKTNKILLNFGSTDPHNHTCKAIQGISDFAHAYDAEVIVVVGSGCPYLAEINEQASHSSLKIQIMIDVKEMAKLLVDIDLAVGAAGASTWERCMLGVPTLLVKTAENQRDVIQRVVSAGAALEYTGDVGSSSLSEALEGLVLEYHSVSKAASNLVDGSGFITVIEQFNPEEA